MSSRNRPLAVGPATAMLVAFAATLFATRGLVDIIVMVVVAALAGLYLLRRYARATLVYNLIPARSDTGANGAAPRRQKIGYATAHSLGTSGGFRDSGTVSSRTP